MRVALAEGLPCGRAPAAPLHSCGRTAPNAAPSQCTSSPPQGPLLSIVSGLAPPSLRGTAFGIFYTVMAVTAVAANTMYGTIWHTYGANAAFATSAALMSAVLFALPHMIPAAAKKGGAAAV